MRRKKTLAAIREYMSTAPVGVARRHYEFRGGGAIGMPSMSAYGMFRYRAVSATIGD
jgi:hypothetical protein